MKSVPEIMVTVGPTLETPEQFGEAVAAGARWFRLPCGYRQRPHLVHARAVREIAAKTATPLALLLDLPSSRPRTGAMEMLSLEIGALVKFIDPAFTAVACATPGAACVPLPGLNELSHKLTIGQRMWFCDGRLEFLIEQSSPDGVLARLKRATGPLKTSNAVGLPDCLNPYTMITPLDTELLASFAAEGLAPDWVALSLVSSPDDVEAGRAEVRRHFTAPVCIMAKIETAAAVEAADSILRACDGIMVARGDLAPAVDFIRLPEVQEELVAAARRMGKVVVVATQILECFAEEGVPQRAELSGLSLLAQQCPDAVMLGKETVFSRRPIESIQMARTVFTHEAQRLAANRRRLPRSLTPSGGAPQVVAIEGPNGAGKTLLCSLLSKRLGLPEIRGVPAGWEEASLKLRMIRDADWLASAMYFLSGVIEASREVGRSGAKLQVMDRSVWSTLAVHFAHDPRRLERLLALLDLAADRVKVPDLTIVLEAGAATCRRRIAGKSRGEQALDAASPADEDFCRREREFYHWLAEQGAKVVFLPADRGDPEDVCRRAADLIREAFPCCVH
jgi:pyruvate kinase/thymidylate kinase